MIFSNRYLNDFLKFISQTWKYLLTVFVFMVISLFYSIYVSYISNKKNTDLVFSTFIETKSEDRASYVKRIISDKSLSKNRMEKSFQLFYLFNFMETLLEKRNVKNDFNSYIDVVLENTENKKERRRLEKLIQTETFLRNYLEFMFVSKREESFGRFLSVGSPWKRFAEFLNKSR
ncbi:hypothetical protein [Candidatus Nesciobacter abundans]|uniref:Uncharacterized protein n=1 Tax=Candidatus Nesciobacter abundans TaxID=2601668 RepID=A0A5C0UHQ1_9PROT|nr:hypothetical protein [Candidatus Nesciobacter abundans]QEK39319.1 hypothetical protein FZC36_02715 [Candidatus Nesciobacter abundans]